MINGHVYNIDIHSLEFDFYHNFIANEYNSIKLCMYIREYSADIHTRFICVYRSLYRVADIHTRFICVYRSLYRVGTLKKPDGDLTDIFCVTDSYYDHKIMEQIEKKEKYTYGGIPVRQGICHEKAHIYF